MGSIVERYLRHIKLYGPDGVLGALSDDRSEFTTAQIIQIMRAAIKAGLKLPPRQLAGAVRGLRKEGFEAGTIASILNISERQVQRLSATNRANQGYALDLPNMSRQSRIQSGLMGGIFNRGAGS